MYPLRFLLIPLSLAPVVLSRPLQITPVIENVDNPLGPDIGDVPPHLFDTVRQVTEAKDEANLMLRKMKQVIANPTWPGHNEIIKASFGPDHNRGKIMETLDKIDNANIRTRVHPPVMPLPPTRTQGTTRWIRPPGHPRAQPADELVDSIGFSQPFYNLNVKGRAGTLIHEAAHYAADAGDHVLEKHTGESHIINRRKGIRLGSKTGKTKLAYREEDFNHPADTPEASSQHLTWPGLINRTPNMHECADAYRVFAHLCDKHMQRRDIHIFTRALTEGDK
jgi:hypothetical protein